MRAPSISVIIPAFNEEEAIESCLESLCHTFPKTSEFLVVDGGSDNTKSIVKRLTCEDPRIRYIRNHDDQGKGHAIRCGISNAEGTYIAFFDSDHQFFATDLLKLVEVLQTKQVDLAIGSRFRSDSPRDEHASFIRNIGNWLVSAYLSLLFLTRITDALAGSKALTSEAAKKIDLKSDRFEYEVEVIAKARRRKLRIAEVPIGTRSRSSGDSKVSVFRVGIRILLSITKFRFISL